MINATKVKQAWSGMVGFLPSQDPAKSSWIDGTNQASSVGMYVNSNEYCKLEYIRQTMDYPNANDTQFNDYIRRVIGDACVSVCNSVFSENDFICRSVLFPNTSNKTSTTTFGAGILLYKIESKEKKSFIISRVLLEFAGTGSIKLMLFHSSQQAPILNKVINITSPQQEDVLDWVVDNTGVNYGGEYYLGYIVNPSLSPYKRNYSEASIQSYINGLNIGVVQKLGHATETLPDLNSFQGVSEYIGVNPDITVVEDWTDLAVNNKRLFAKALLIQSQINFIHSYKANYRINSMERNIDSRLLANMVQEVEGQYGDGLVRIVGLRSKLSAEISLIKSELKKLNNNYFGSGFLKVKAH